MCSYGLERLLVYTGGIAAIKASDAEGRPKKDVWEALGVRN